MIMLTLSLSVGRSILIKIKGGLDMKIMKIWFDADYIYGTDEKGKEYKQSLLWYPKLTSNHCCGIQSCVMPVTRNAKNIPSESVVYIGAPLTRT